MKTLLFLRKITTHRYLAFLFRLYIGALFIYASMYKINYSGEFAETIASYQMIPFWAVNFLAIVLPWIELISGSLLLAGIRTRSAALLLGALLVLFTSAIIVNLIREAPISCGCFHSLEETISGWTVLRDLLWLGMTSHIFFFDQAFHFERRLSGAIEAIKEI